MKPMPSNGIARCVEEYPLAGSNPNVPCTFWRWARALSGIREYIRIWILANISEIICICTFSSLSQMYSLKVRSSLRLLLLVAASVWISTPTVPDNDRTSGSELQMTELLRVSCRFLIL